MLSKKWIFVAASLITFIPAISIAIESIEVTRALKVSGGENHSLVLIEDKSVWACGANGGNGYYGVLGIGSNNPYLIRLMLVRVHGPGNVGYLEDINDIAAGWTHSLALDVNHFVWAWGDNYWGQLGDNTRVYKDVPVQVHGVNNVDFLGNIIAISAGRSGEHSLAVDANNFVYAWGINDSGQLGNGENGNYKLTPVHVLSGEQGLGTYLKNIVTVSAGEAHSMALDVNGFVWTWGLNDCGEIGNNDPYYNIYDTPVQVLSGEQDPNNPNSPLENIVAISAGWDHSMALEKYDPADPNCWGRVYTWGLGGPGPYGYDPPPQYYSPYGGRLGNGTADDSNTPVKVKAGEQDPCNPNSYLKNIIAISAGEGHSMALDIYGNVWTWGDNYYGQLGNGTNDPCSLTPVKVVGLNGEGYLENIVAISAGYWHCLAIDAYGTIWTWGLGEKGNLGRGNKNFNTPQFIPVVCNVTHTPQTFNFRIQGAINDAVNGDIIKAMPGSFYENVDFGNKNITLRSADPNNLGVVSNTIINGYQNDNNDVVAFNNNSNSVLAGFTITNSAHYGIDCFSSSPQITNCIIKDNSYSGIYGSGTSAAVIKNNWIFNNGTYGGIYLYYPASAAVIRNNTICDNAGFGIECSSGTRSEHQQLHHLGQ